MKRLVLISILVGLLGLPAAAQPGVFAPPPMAQPPLMAWNAQPDPSAQQSERLESELLGAIGRLEEATETKARLEEESGELSERWEQVNDQLRSRGRALYRLRRAGMLPVAGGFDAMLTHLARVERLERMVKRDLDAADFLRARRASMGAEKVDAERALEQAQADVDRLRGEQAEAERRAQALELYGGLLDSPAPQLPVAPLDSGYGMRVHGASHGFARLRGSLGFPVAGSGEITDAQRDDGHGLDIAVPVSTPVRTVADGRVAFARRYGRYGLMVVIDHGESFYTVYAGLGHLNVEVGDVVRGGSNLGGAGGQPLYFEVRRGTRSLDTRSWLGL